MSLRTLLGVGKAREGEGRGAVARAKGRLQGIGGGLHAGARAMGVAGHRKTPKSWDGRR